MPDCGCGTRRVRATATLSLAAIAMLAPTPAVAIVGDSDQGVGLDGSLRTISAATANHEVSGQRLGPRSDGQAQALLRLVLAGHPSLWLSYEIHAIQNVALRTCSSATGSMAGTDSGLRYRAVDDRWRWHDTDSVNARADFDRLNVKLTLAVADVTLGRQAITFGKAYFWNPLDVFLSFDPTAFDRDYKGGVDALRIDFPLGDFSGLTIVGVLGRPHGGHMLYRSAALARVFTTFLDWDLSAQGGKIFAGFHAGLGATGELGPIEARIEAAYVWPARSLLPKNAVQAPQGLAAVVAAGRYFNVFDRTLSLQGEYLFNGAAGSASLSDNFVLVAKGMMLQASEHAAGATISYALAPLLHTSLAAIAAISERPSVILQPGILFSAADEVDLLAGAMLAFGDRPTLDAATGVAPQSEFGSYPHMFYIETKAYF